MSSSDDSEEEEYPFWLEKIVNGQYHDHVKVLKEEDDDSHPGYVRCKEVEVPDAADAAENKPDMRTCKLRRLTPVLIVAEPAEPPYVALIEKIWRKADAKPVAQDTYRTSDFKLECYWFYRPREVPETAWQHVKRRTLVGGQYMFPKQRKPRREEFSERQLLFSSHHTRHDYPADNGLLSMESFIQTCKLHWLGLRAAAPERYSIHGGRLMRVREPGFLVQGFLWCNSKHKEQFHADDKRVFPLEGDWGDQDTMDIVAAMKKKYEKTAQDIKDRNKKLQDKYEAYQAKKAAGAYRTQVSSDDGGMRSQHRSQQTTAAHHPPSPQLPGIDDSGAGDGDDDGFGSGGGVGGGGSGSRFGGGQLFTGPGALGSDDDDD